MKLSHLQEAKYYKHPAVELVRQSAAQLKPLNLEFPLKQLESTISVLTREFGPPEYQQEVWTGGSMARWVWDTFTVHQYEEFGYLESHEPGE